MEMSIIKMKLFPFISKESFKKEKYLFTHKINDLIKKNRIEEEEREQEMIKAEDRSKVGATVPRNFFSQKETKELLSTNFSNKMMSNYYSMKETVMKVPLSFKVHVKNSQLPYKDSGGDKQNYFKFTSKQSYNFTDDLGIFKKFYTK